MKESFQKPSAAKHPAVWWSRNKPRWPFLVWVAAAVVAFYLYASGSVAIGTLTGVVDKEDELIAPLEGSIISQILVREGEMVKAGQALVQMDTSIIDHEIKVEEAYGLQQESDAGNYREQVLNSRRQFAAELSSAEASLMDQERLLAEARAETDVLKVEEARLQKLVDQRMADTRIISDLGTIRARMASLAESIALYPKSIASTRTNIVEMRKQLALLENWLKVQPAQDGKDQTELVDTMIEQTRNLHMQQRELLLARRELYTLRANGDGIVSQVLLQNGSMVNAGVPILSVIHAAGNRVIALIPESEAAFTIATGTPAVIQRDNTALTSYKAVVESLGPEIFNLPTRINPMTQMPVRGRRVVLTLTEPHVMVPGETVRIALGTPSLFSRAISRIRRLSAKGAPSAPGNSTAQGK